ncbi:AAA family ATPase [Lentzea xinjiangensis]|nr:AAA family ATPase [Lentzea xinjiangensis]
MNNVPAGEQLATGGGSVRLPVVQTIEINNFSLYRENPRISLSFGDGVFCLAGANGLGKSTFLAILNYAITGIVANPDQKFMSLKEYYKDSLKYSGLYFTGRVFELERHLAEVTISFTVGRAQYSLTRGIFEPRALRKLKVLNSSTENDYEHEIESADEDAASELHSVYVRKIVQDAGLATFDQLVFLQHFLLTFDERRHLLFWDPEVAQQALFLAFGVDGELAEKADEWRRIADRLESQARNAQYQATTARQRKEEIQGRAGTTTELNPDLLLAHSELTQARDQTARVRDLRSRDVSDASLVLSRATAKRHALESDYDRAFNERLKPGANPRQHSLVSNLITQHTCGICGTHADGVEESAVSLMADDKCPLCQTSTKRTGEPGIDFQHLERLDNELASAVQEVTVAESSLTRLTKELEIAENDYADARERLKEFEKQNDISAEDVAKPEPDDVLSKLVKQLEAEQQSAVERRDDFRRTRDEYRSKLTPVQNELAEKYFEAEVEFVPKFQELAYQFLGLDLRVNMEQRAKGAELTLEIEGTRRRMTTQLSESQRYFVDIALRMALAQHMVGEGNPACLYIDTPEGSLDIAYENRAGSMFGKFAVAGNKLVMTANINSSRLVQQLAHICGADRMKIERMTEWTVLSEVQAESEALFDEAYRKITGALYEVTP